MLADGLLQTVKAQTGGIATVVSFVDADFATTSPLFKLFDSGGAEGVSGVERILLFRLQFGRLFADGGGFAGAVDANHQYNKRVVGKFGNLQFLFARAQNGLNISRQFGFDLV